MVFLIFFLSACFYGQSNGLECFSCTSYMAQCGKVVDQYSRAVAKVDCESKCYMRIAEGQAIYRGCFDEFYGAYGLRYDYDGCQLQSWNGKKTAWCICSDDKCNGQSFEDMLTPIDGLGKTKPVKQGHYSVQQRIHSKDPHAAHTINKVPNVAHTLYKDPHVAHTVNKVPHPVHNTPYNDHVKHEIQKKVPHKSQPPKKSPTAHKPIQMGYKSAKQYKKQGGGYKNSNSYHGNTYDESNMQQMQGTRYGPYDNQNGAYGNSRYGNNRYGNSRYGKRRNQRGPYNRQPYKTYQGHGSNNANRYNDARSYNQYNRDQYGYQQHGYNQYGGDRYNQYNHQYNGRYMQQPRHQFNGANQGYDQNLQHQMNRPKSTGTHTIKGPHFNGKCYGDGLSQNEEQCQSFIACVGGVRYTMNCPSDLLWDDVRKSCERTSKTCHKYPYSASHQPHQANRYMNTRA